MLPGAPCIRCKSLSCRRDLGLDNSDNDAPIYCVWDTSLCYVCFACLQSWNREGLRGLDCFLRPKFIVVAVLLSVFFFANMLPGELTFILF